MSRAVEEQPHSPLVLFVLCVLVFAVHAVFFLTMRSWYPEWEPPVSMPIATASRGRVPVLFLAACLRLFDDPYFPILIASWLLSAGNALLAYVLTRRLTEDSRLALVAALLAGVHFSEMYINTTFSYCSEPLFMHLLGWSVYVTLRAAERGSVRQATAAGLLLGLACLARPMVIFLPLGFFGVFWADQRRRGLRLAMAACLAFASVQVPWVLRNQDVFDRPVLTTTLNGYGLYLAAVAARDHILPFTPYLSCLPASARSHCST
jgi:4-amino-4-deoxy-L-arabinose transferase-like glycosyltransferase